MQSQLISNPNIALTAVARQPEIRVYNPAAHHGRKFGNLWVLGPNYRANCTSFQENAKKEAVNDVLRHSPHSLSEIKTEIGKIENAVRAAYDVNVVNGLQSPEFQEIMVVDGCFFLLLAFSILGAGTGLKFPEDHPLFGTGWVNQYMGNWLESMFYVGNQIPFIVLEKIMDLTFLKELKTSLRFERYSELEKTTLHNFLIDDQNPKPVDLIHCLQSVMLGPKGGSKMAVGMKDKGTEEIISASMLSKRGIKFCKLEGELGIRGMHFERNTCAGPILHLPVLKINTYTGLLVRCLLQYEIAQEPRGFEPEALPFFKFLNELIHTLPDIRLLESEEVIQGQSGSLHGILKSLHDIVSSGKMHYVKREIVGYRPWNWQKLLKWAALIGSVLTFLVLLLQTNYGILDYYKDQKA